MVTTFVSLLSKHTSYLLTQIHCLQHLICVFHHRALITVFNAHYIKAKDSTYALVFEQIFSGLKYNT
jgi:hypothetical protein